MVQTHNLKTWPEYFEQVILGLKSYELRRNDRDFQVGDFLCLQEWDPKTESYTGRECRVRVTYMYSAKEGDNWGLLPGYCILSFTPNPRLT